MSTTQNPLQDTRKLTKELPVWDEASFTAVQEMFAAFPGPQPVLGSWQDHVAWLAAWHRTSAPSIRTPLIAVFAGSHNVAGRSYEGDIITAAQDRIDGLTKGQSGLRGMASQLGAAFKVFEMGQEYPVPDITQDESLSELDCAKSIAFGMEVVAEGADIIVLGNAGFGSATAAAAIAKGLYGGNSEYWAGGQHASAESRIESVELATAHHKAAMSDPLECLRVFGGRDIAGLVGAILAARHQSIPIILDGFIVCVAAAILHRLNPDAISHCRAGHLSSEPAHEALLDRLGLKPMIDFGVPLGDGTGAAYALNALALSVSGYETLSSAK